MKAELRHQESTTRIVARCIAERTFSITWHCPKLQHTCVGDSHEDGLCKTHSRRSTHLIAVEEACHPEQVSTATTIPRSHLHSGRPTKILKLLQYIRCSAAEDPSQTTLKHLQDLHICWPQTCRHHATPVLSAQIRLVICVSSGSATSTTRHVLRFQVGGGQ